MTFLSEAEQTAVVRFSGDKVMRQAVEKVLLYTIYTQGKLSPDEAPNQTNWVFSLVENGLGGTKDNEQLGMEVRASIAALGYLKSGFDHLDGIRLPEVKKEKKNPAL